MHGPGFGSERDAAEGEGNEQLNLEEDVVKVVVLGESAGIREGMTVFRTNTLLSVPVGDGIVGRVVNALGQPIDGRGPITATEFRPTEARAPGVIDRNSSLI